MKQIQRKESVACFNRWSRKGYSAFRTMNQHVKIGVLCVGMSIISLASNEAYAAPADSLSVDKVVDLAEIGVTLSKENPTRSAMSQTPLFNRVNEVAAPLQTLESALRLSPSIDVRERGGKGVQTDLSIRGGSFDQTMVMLNGINFTDARTGHQTHSLPIDIESVAGIELIDGISGVGAYAGAINIRTAPIKSEYIRLEHSMGQHGYSYSNLSGATSVDGFTLFAAGSFRGSDGYRENTEFENYNGYVRATYDTDNAGFFDAQIGFQDRAFGANGFYSLKFPNQFEKTKTALGSLRWVKQFGRFALNSSVSYRKNFDQFELIHNDPQTVPFNYHNTDNFGAELYGDYAWSAGTTTLGVDYTYNHIWSTVLGEKQDEANGKYTHAKSRTVGNYYLRHTKEWGKWGTTASYGLSTTPYGNSSLWSLSGNYRPCESLRFEAGATQSMRLPTFNDLYYTTTGYISDPNLRPEQAVTYRVNGSYTRSKWDVSALVYLRDGNNIIDWVKESADADWRSEQITSLQTTGVELSANYRPEVFIHRIGVTYGSISMDKDSNGLISKYATDYMRNKASGSMEFRFARNFTLVVTGSYFDREGSYIDASGAVNNYSPYFLLDSRLSWEKNGVRVYVDATNITSTKYFDYGGLEMPKVWALAGISLTL